MPPPAAFEEFGDGRNEHTAVESRTRDLGAGATDSRTAIGRARRLNVVADVSDVVAGPVAARRVREIARNLDDRCRVAVIDTSFFEVPRAEFRGWRVVVGRRAIVVTLFESLQENRLQIDVAPEIAREAASQIKNLTTKPDRGDLALEEEVLARTVALTVWVQASLPTATGGIVRHYGT